MTSSYIEDYMHVLKVEEADSDYGVPSPAITKWMSSISGESFGGPNDGACMYHIMYGTSNPVCDYFLAVSMHHRLCLFLPPVSSQGQSYHNVLVDLGLDNIGTLPTG